MHPLANEIEEEDVGHLQNIIKNLQTLKVGNLFTQM